MRRWLAPLALLVAIPAWGQEAAPSTAAAPTESTAALAAAAVELAALCGCKAVFYGEVDDQRTGEGPIIGFTAVAQNPQTLRLVMADGQQMVPLMQLLSTAAQASNDHWRTVLIVVDQGQASVVTGQRIGPIEGYNRRLHAQVDAVFPGQP